MTQLIADSLSRLLGANPYPLMLLPTPVGVFCLEKTMSDIIQLTPNKWVSEEVLMAITGLTKNAIKSARTNSWMEGREYRHYSGDCQPKENSPILYNRHEVDNWVERQRPAIPRQKSA